MTTPLITPQASLPIKPFAPTPQILAPDVTEASPATRARKVENGNGPEAFVVPINTHVGQSVNTKV